MFTIFTGSEVRDRWEDSLLQEISHQVAARTIPQMSSSSPDMNPAELRGYIRSRIYADVQQLVRECLRDLRMRRRMEGEFTNAVLERAIHLIARDISTAPVSYLPQPHVHLRDAA